MAITSKFHCGRRVALVLLGTLVLPGSAGSTARGQCPEIGSFHSNDKGLTQLFGSAVAESGDRLVIGALFDSTKGTFAGSAYVFEWDASVGDWVQKQELFASDAAPRDWFGSRVAISGDVILVGAQYADTALGTDAGAAYVFRRDSSTGVWSQEQKLTPTTGGASDLFGRSLALSGKVAVVGAPFSSSLGVVTGSAFVFRDTGGSPRWVQEQQLLDSDGTSSDGAGVAVATDGTTTFVGSSFATHAGGASNTGVVSVWTVSGSTWTQGADLVASDGAFYDEFGASLSLDGGGLLVGAPDHSEGATNDGVAYVFRNGASGWTQETKLVVAGSPLYSYWGWSVALRGDVAVLATPWLGDGTNTQCGAGYVFRRVNNVWYADHSVLASDRTPYDALGTSAAITAHDILLGAPYHESTSGTSDSAGRIYRFATPEIVTLITPSDPAPGASVTFRTLCGDPGDPVMLMLTSIDGAPTSFVVVVTGFAPDDTLTLAGNAPSPALGRTLGFTSFKIGVKGNVVKSAEAFVDL